MLSEIDQIIFDRLSVRSWRNAIDVIAGTWRRSVDFVGLELILSRLFSWAKAMRADPVLLSHVESGGDGGLRTMLFKLTERGAEIRRRGLSRHDELPADYLAGVRPIRSRRWVRIRKRGEWTLQRI
jgi:hypothetical protein